MWDFKVMLNNIKHYKLINYLFSYQQKKNNFLKIVKTKKDKFYTGNSLNQLKKCLKNNTVITVNIFITSDNYTNVSISIKYLI